MRQEVRLVLAGDAGVGKSTLITSLIKESFVEDVQELVPELTLPADVSPEGVSTKIVDTCGTWPFSRSWTGAPRKARNGAAPCECDCAGVLCD